MFRNVPECYHHSSLLREMKPRPQEQHGCQVTEKPLDSVHSV